MKRKSISVLSLLLTLMLLVSSTFTLQIAAADAPVTYSVEYNSGSRNVVCTSLDGTSASTYYQNYDFDELSAMSSNALFSSLQTLMRNTHTYTSSYDDCHYKADKTDCTNGSGNVSLIYTSYSATMSQWNGWNREHVWPKSLGGDSTKGGGADMHHIRPSDAVVNSTRSNKRYGNVDSNAKTVSGKNPAVGVVGGTYNSSYFEPLDEVKGDVARICLYVYVRWNSQWGAESITDVFQSVDVLLEWCELDPVDTWEMGRNEVVGHIQGNRNVFIDYPEYAWLIFGKNVPNDMSTPSGEAKNMSSSQGGTVTPPAGGDQSSSTTPAGGEQGSSTTPTGNQSTSTPSTTVGTQGEITMNGECDHLFGEWEAIGTTGGRSRTCSKCGIFEFSSKTESETSQPIGCESSFNTAAAFVVFLPILGAIFTIKKKKVNEI